MNLSSNPFKAALRNGEPQIGLWVGLADAYVTELLATTGFDWLLLDAEHAPNDVRSILSQLQAAAAYPVHCVVRPPVGESVLIKQYLDLGVQTLLIPMVESAKQAAAMVRATRYPPHGTRGVGSALARSSRWNQIDGYPFQADAQICLLVQVESKEALMALPEIVAVEGVHGVFFGPADLSASMGYLGDPGAPAVQDAIDAGIATVLSENKAAGILSSDRKLAHRYLQLGATFVAVGVDTTLLARGARELANEFNASDDDTRRRTLPRSTSDVY